MQIGDARNHVIRAAASVITLLGCISILATGCPLWVMEASGTCWNAEFTADRCCGDANDKYCWWNTNQNDGFSFDRCCDADGRAAAAGVRARWEEAFSGKVGGGQEGQRLAGCLRAGAPGNAIAGPSRILRAIDFSTKPAFPLQAGRRNSTRRFRTSTSRHRRFQFRRDSIQPLGRCAARARTHQTHTFSSTSMSVGINEGDPLSVRLLELLGGPAHNARWIVNIGAGCYLFMAGRDPMDAVVERWNLSAVLIDPMGPCGGRNAGDAATAEGSTADGRKRVRFVKAAANPRNLCELLGRGGLRCSSHSTVPIQILKIDIDSCDCEVAASALSHLRPKAVWLEVNLAFPPPLRFARGCHTGFFAAWLHWSRQGRTFATFGCSLSAAVELMASEGYGLYGLDGTDAVFVDLRQFGDVVGGAGVDEFACYYEAEGPMHLPVEFVQEWAVLTPEQALARVWCNLSLHDQLLGIRHIPFTLSL